MCPKSSLCALPKTPPLLTPAGYTNPDWLCSPKLLDSKASLSPPNVSYPSISWTLAFTRVSTTREPWQLHSTRYRPTHWTPFRCLLGFPSAPCSVNQHFAALFQSSPSFSPDVWSLQISLCFLLFSLVAREGEEQKREEKVMLRAELSCSLSHRLWSHLSATSSQPYCLKLDVILRWPVRRR